MVSIGGGVWQQRRDGKTKRESHTYVLLIIDRLCDRLLDLVSLCHKILTLKRSLIGWKLAQALAWRYRYKHESIGRSHQVNPIVNPNWLLDPRDQEIAIAAFKQGCAVFTNNNATRTVIVRPEAFTGPNVTTDAQILDLIQHSAAASYPASATCAMGKAWRSYGGVGLQGSGVWRARVCAWSMHLAFPVLPTTRASFINDL